MLQHITVLDLSTVLAGPSVATFFAELGAKVIKIEHPVHHDATRSWRIPGETHEVTSYFSSINYQKKYVQLDLTRQEDFVKFKELVLHADILVMNFKRSDYRKFNIEDRDIKAINPNVIIGKITGFGDDSDRVAYDLILQAEAGFMAMNGEPNSQGLKMPIAMVDVLAAHQLKEALLLALLWREKYGEARSVSVSLYDAAVCSLVNQASAYLMNGMVPKPMGSLHPNIAPYGEVFTTIENKKIVFAIGSDAQFQKLCTLLNLPNVPKDARFHDNVSRVKNRGELFEIIQNAVAQLEADELEQVMLAASIPMGRIKTLDEVFLHPKAQALVREEMQGNTTTQRVSQLAFQWK
jgi:crotonobetainyl-CoA:carnitine CoA-transferase CaiB-like acyl-CoA transferase